MRLIHQLAAWVCCYLLLAAGQVWAQAKVSGQVVDERNQPLPGATVIASFNAESQPFTGTSTDENGRFSLSIPQNGNFLIQIEFIGYKPTRRNISLSGSDIQLGTLRMAPDVQTIKEVQIVEEKETIQTGIGTMVYDVSKDLVNMGGSATDVLQNIPSVQVDENGGISLRGNANVMILINGKQSALTGTNRQALLERIPASSIERIEVITNPSARYDADGGAGIINIVLKRPKEKGLNGSVQLNLGNYDRHNAGFDLNYQTPKWNLYTSLNGRQDTRIGRITVRRENFLPNTTPFLNQNSEFERFRRSGTFTGGAEYFFNEKHSLRLEGIFGLEGSREDRLVNNRSLDADRQLMNYFFRNSAEVQDENNYSVSLNYDWRIRGSDHTLTAYAAYNQNWRDENTNFWEQYFNADGSTAQDDFLQRSRLNGTNGMWIFQLDYKRPITKNIRFESGAKSIIRNVSSNFVLEDRLNENWITNTGFTNNFEFNEQIHAAYLLTAARIAQWEMEVGLRGEKTNTLAHLITTDERFTLDYFNLFPSLAVARKINSNNKLQFTYSRRINRPSFRDLNPFRTFSNPLVQRSGNPFLRPELTQSLEAGYQHDRDKLTLTTNIFYKYTDDVIQGILGQQVGDTVVYFPQNIASAHNYGAELILNLRPNRRINWNISTSYYRLIIDGRNLDESVLNDAFAWDIRSLFTWSLPGEWRIQANLFYRSPSATAQGTRFEFFMNGIGISKRVLNRKGNINFNVRDVAQTMRFGSERLTEALYNYFEFRGNTRVITVGFQYTFGQEIKKRRQQNGRRGGFDGGGDFEGGDGM